MSSLCRSKVFTLVVTAFATCAFAVPAFAQQQSDPKAQTNPLLQLLQTKGILTAEEAALVTQASSPADSNQRLAKVLLGKGLITQEEYNQTVGASVTPVAAQGFSEARMIPAVLRLLPRNPEGLRPISAAAAPVPKEPAVIPAVVPLRVLPIDLPKQGGLIPDIKLGSGAKIKLYGFFKASAVEDTASSGGPLFGNNDFPLPLLLGDTGPTSNPEFHLKARSFRMGALFEWVPKDSPFTVTGKLEYDFEGDFTNVNNRNISGVRSSTPGIRLAFARLDTKLGGRVPWFAEFGQDWTILGSSTLPSLFETTGLGIAMGSFYERLPQFRTGVQFGSGSLKVQPEIAIVLPVAGSPGLTDEQRTRFGDRAGSDSNQPGIQGRIVFQFPLSNTWKGVAPAQIIFSGGHARFNEIIPAGNLLNTAVAGASGCAKPLPGGGCSVLSFFPKGLELSSPQNIWTAEVQLPTPWVTFVAKYYNGGDMRFYFADQLNDVFADLNGAPLIAGTAGSALSFSNRTIPFGLLPTGQIVASTLRPIHGQGGFGEVSFPLSRIFNANPEGRNTGWVLHLGFGTDRTKARDARRGNGLVRTDIGTGSLTYKLNNWVSFVNEVSYIDTRAATPGAKTFRGLPATQAHSWRSEFGTVFTF